MPFGEREGRQLRAGAGTTERASVDNAQFAAVFWNHAPQMLRQSKETGIPAPMFQGQEMTDLLTFLASLRYFEPTGTATAGAKVFTDRGCAACHGSIAEGTPAGPALKARARRTRRSRLPRLCGSTDPKWLIAPGKWG